MIEDLVLIFHRPFSVSGITHPFTKEIFGVQNLPIVMSNVFIRNQLVEILFSSIQMRSFGGTQLILYPNHLLCFTSLVIVLKFP